MRKKLNPASNLNSVSLAELVAMLCVELVKSVMELLVVLLEISVRSCGWDVQVSVWCGWQSRWIRDASMLDREAVWFGE